MRSGQSRWDERQPGWDERQPGWDERQSRWDGAVAPARYAASKVPLITVYFWIIKLLTTAMGEAASDYLVRAISPVTAVLLGFTGFVVAMVLQLRAKRYVPWIYWLAVAMVAVFGTQAADVLHIKFGVPYAASTAFYACVLAVIFILWYRSEHTLSIHSIRTPRRELFYWATVLATFALGTAAGDMTARTLNLGYLASGIWFSVAFAAVAIAHWKFRLNPILAFWIAYVLTRPVGASFADWVAFPRSVGGLDVGHGPVALFLTFLIVILVGYLTVTRIDVEDSRQAAGSRTAGPQAADSQAASRHRRGAPRQPGYPAASRPVPPAAYERPHPSPRGEWADSRWRPARDERPAQDQWPAAGERPRRDERASRDEWAPRDPWPARDDWPGHDERPQRERRPSHRSWDTGEETEAERTAWGFFAWDE